MRRSAGVGAIKNKNLAQARYKDKGTEIAEDQISQMAKQMEVFKSHLETFAAKHKDDIRKDPVFRVHFQDMCASIGVDPLASSKGFWAEMLGVGDFYYELGVQIIEVCMATSHRNGGLMQLDDLLTKLSTSRSKSQQEISVDDLLRAIKKLKVLGSGFSLIPMGNNYVVQSIPRELSLDHTIVIQQAESKGYVTESALTSALKWERARVCESLDHLVQEGLVWVDDQGSEGRQYWFPGLFTLNT